MKILMVNKFLYENGGSETYIFKLGEQLKSLGHQVQYFGMEHQGRCVGNNAQQYTTDMDFHTSSKLKKLSYPLKTIYSSEAKKKISIVLNDFQPDIIHLNNFNYQLTPSILYAINSYKQKSNKKIKVIYTAHDYQLICPNHMMMNSRGEICNNCIGGKFINCTKNNCIHSSKAKSIIGTAEATLYKSLKAYKYIDTIICCSEFMKQQMDTNPLFASKTITLHNFIDQVEKKQVQKDNYFLYFGRYSKEKGIETIIDCKGIDFVLAGSGDLEEKINSQSHIKNVGFKTGVELEDLIRKAKCSVYPSIWYENCPFSVMESIMYGTPVVGANIGGIPELIENEKTGILFESSNVDDFKKAINSIITNDEKAKQMSENCLNAHFDTVEEYCNKLLAIYNS
jgi:glycosyltransferase involved in cell wall biosynthesis